MRGGPRAAIQELWEGPHPPKLRGVARGAEPVCANSTVQASQPIPFLASGMCAKRRWPMGPAPIKALGRVSNELPWEPAAHAWATPAAGERGAGRGRREPTPGPGQTSPPG